MRFPGFTILTLLRASIARLNATTGYLLEAFNDYLSTYRDCPYKFRGPASGPDPARIDFPDAEDLPPASL